MTLAEVLAFLARLAPFAPEIEQILTDLESGADKQAILAASRTAAIAASDEAMKRAAGLPL